MATHYNNFYEFGSAKEDPARNAGRLRTRPWSVVVDGECEAPGRIDVDELLKPQALEERIYRHRCVEAWSMVAPWIGLPLSDLLKRFKPTSKAKYVAFTTLYDPKQMPETARGVLSWPYREGLRIDEAMHPLAFLSVGLYGRVLPNQDGAPLRLTLPWKYGFRPCREFRGTMLRSSGEGSASGGLLCKMTANKTYNVLFLCTGNSARSILAESLLNHWGQGKFRAFSAGSFPKGQVHPLALDLLKRMNLPAEGFRSKSRDEFAAPGAPPIDFIFTVCDNAAGEVCPFWPGKPMTAHWGIADPAAVEGTDADKAFAFRKALKELETRIKLFTSLPIDSLDGMTLQAKLRAIGNPAPEPV